MPCTWIRRLNIVNIHSLQIDLRSSTIPVIILVDFFIEIDWVFLFVCFFHLYGTAEDLESPK